MAINYDEIARTFHLSNKKISYVIGILPNGQLNNIYFGKKIRITNNRKNDIDYNYRVMHPCVPNQEEYISLNFVPQEIPTFGQGDYRPESLRIEKIDGNQLDRFAYQSHQIVKGKQSLTSLPEGRPIGNKVESLIILLRDNSTGITAELQYTLYEDLSLITRSIKVTNHSKDAIQIRKIMSLSLDLPDCHYESLQLDGAWARERYMQRNTLRSGDNSISSIKGASSAEHNPFIALLRPETTEHQGEVIATALIYSGNFLANINVSTFGITRLQIGIEPSTFSWYLDENESFQTPEAVLAYSNDGLNDLSHTFHQFINRFLINPKWQNYLRPIVYNNWEATYMNFNENQLINLAEEAADLGMELFVLDDGWFGERENDRMSLGDWVVNSQKFPNGLDKLIETVNKNGLYFGIWIEPEMINEESNLYKENPDWLIHHPQYHKSASRNQYVLDYSRKEVVAHIFDMLSLLLDTYPINYVKWDMNRYISEPFSLKLPSHRQGEFYHRYILGVYELYEKLTQKFPDILFESCSSGGARFDLGLLYYAPQTWTSDNTDAMDRLKIQHGTSIIYPPVSMGAHVSAVPNHQTGRVTSLETRANVAFFGNFGYELDLLALSNQEKIIIKKQIEFYKKYRQNFQYGKFYRLLSPFKGEETSWQVISEDQQTIIVGYYRFRRGINELNIRIKLKGLKNEAIYKYNNQFITGGELMEIGLILTPLELSEEGKDFNSRLIILHKK